MRITVQDQYFISNKVGIGTTAVPDTNQLLVKGGTETDRLNITGVSTYGGNVDINANIDVSGTSTFGGLVDINAGGQANTFKVEDLTSGRVVLAGTGGELEDSNNLRFDGTNLIVTGTTDTDNFINAGVSTFVGIITASATENVIPFLYSAFSDLPSASAYHGAFAHVHARGKGYFAHAANWYELVNKELDGTIGVGTEQVRVGVTTVTTFNATGNVTLGDADTDNVVFTRRE